jgi:hypothetical protein
METRTMEFHRNFAPSPRRFPPALFSKGGEIPRNIAPRGRGFHQSLEILIIVAQKRKKSCLKIAHFSQKVATLQESCSKVATLVALPSTAILTFEQF